MLNNAIGGVPLEAYLPVATMAMDSNLSPLTKEDWLSSSVYPRWTAERVMQNLAAWQEGNKHIPMPVHPYQPGFLFDAAITPLRKLAIKGVLWYQGESNATYTADSTAMDAALNKKKLQLLIKSWRSFFNAPDMPFLLVQLPSIKRDWALYREVQMEVSKESTHVSLIVTTDLGHSADVHPRNKKTVGERAAKAALADVYGYPVESSPVLQSYRTDGNSMLLSFSHSLNGLTTKDGEPVRRISISGADRKFYPARVQFINKGLKVFSPEVSNPVSVRYAYEDNPFDANLVNQSGIPVSPFRTDKW